jgi:ABC-type Zn2+ transport system substrate-binding protein/surface adhesin
MKKLNITEWIKGSLLALTALAVATGVTVSAVNHAKSTLVIAEVQSHEDKKKDEHKNADHDKKKDEHKSHDDHKDGKEHK